MTAAAGAKTEGRLVRIDDFLVTLALADGAIQPIAATATCRRWRSRIRCRAISRNMLRGYSNTDMHDVTAYLVTLK